MRGNMLDNGDAVSSGDNGGFAPGAKPGIIEIVKHHRENVLLGGEPIAEEELVKSLLARLGAEGIQAEHVQIDRDGRDVVLRGAVATNDLRGIAESVVRGTPGVTSVVNELRVDSTISDAG